MLMGLNTHILKMKQTSLLTGLYFTCIAMALGQAPVPAPANAAQGAPVSYASITQLNGMLAQLEATSKNTQADLVKLRIEHWKTGGADKKQALGWVDSIQRNLQGALPEIVSQLRAAPEDLPASFKLYRNLDALCSVLASVTESAGAFAPKDDFQSLSNDLDGFDGSRKQLGERIDTLATSKEAEIVRLRTDLKAAQAVAEPPKKIVVDDNAPPKKPAAPKKKPAAKPGTGTSTTTAKPSAGSTQTPSSTTQTPAKPQ